MDNFDRTYWVARRKLTGQLEAGSKGVTPHLYLSLKMAMAAKRSLYVHEPNDSPLGYSYRPETDAELLDRYEFIEVNLTKVI
jgi:hypothetical protein